MAGRGTRLRKGAIRERAREVYREAILDAAERVFARDGLPGTKMTEVAREAGLATGTLYNYFDSKEQIFRSLVELRLEEYNRQLAEACEAAADDRGRIAALVRATFSFLEAHRAMYAVFLGLGGGSRFGVRAVGGERAAELQEVCVATFERVLAEAAAAGLVRADVTATDLGSFLAGAMNGMTQAWVLSKDDRSVDEHVELVVELFLRGANV